jgi:hypothetical protein
MKPTKTALLLIKALLQGILILSSLTTFSQSKDDTVHGADVLPRFISVVNRKANKMAEGIEKKSLMLLENMQRREEKIFEKMMHGKDSLLAKDKLTELRQKYSSLKSKIKSSATGQVSTYIPHLDSLVTSLKFVQANAASGKINDAIEQAERLQNKFQQAEEITQFIKERKDALTAQLEKLGKLKQLKHINKQVYYYAAQLKEYKEILKDPKKIERKAIELLAKTKAFQEFFKKNSLLAKLFRMPGDPNDPAYMASLSGLQTRSQVYALVQQQIQNGGPNAGQVFQQNISGAQAQLKKLQNSITGFGRRGSDDIMPEGFKPNSQKSKSVLQRIEVGTNFQTQKGSNYFPNNTDLGLSLGYKLNDKSIIGIGASYKMGMGRGWDAIKFTSEGGGLRSFIDWKIKGSFWISGGFEMNYRSAFNRFDQLRNYSSWQRSGLIGISKSMPIKTRFFKKTKIQMLWDFLSYQQIPKTQPIVFRIGYNIK